MTFIFPHFRKIFNKKGGRGFLIRLLVTFRSVDRVVKTSSVQTFTPIN